MTTKDPGAALALTIHSRTASETEMLTTEFFACYLIAVIAWENQDIRTDFENTTRTQRLQRQVNESMECEPPSALPQLLVSCHMYSAMVLC